MFYPQSYSHLRDFDKLKGIRLCHLNCVVMLFLFDSLPAQSILCNFFICLFSVLVFSFTQHKKWFSCNYLSNMHDDCTCEDVTFAPNRTDILWNPEEARVSIKSVFVIRYQVCEFS